MRGFSGERDVWVGSGGCLCVALPTRSCSDPRPPTASPLPCAAGWLVTMTSHVTVGVMPTFLPFPE